MKFSTTATLFAIAVSGGAAFAPSPSFRRQATTSSTSTIIHSSVEVIVEAPSEESPQVEVVKVEADKEDYKGPITAEYINSRLEAQLAKLRLKDQTSKQLEKEVRPSRSKSISFRIQYLFFICTYCITHCICIFIIPFLRTNKTGSCNHPRGQECSGGRQTVGCLDGSRQGKQPIPGGNRSQAHQNQRFADW
jgi:hypothetical protein